MRLRSALLLLAIGIVLLGGGAVLVQTHFTMPTWTQDSGGGVMQGAGYTLNATVGQAEADMLAGGDYTMFSGLWGGQVSGGSQSGAILYVPSVTVAEPTSAQGQSADSEPPALWLPQVIGP